MTHDQHNEAPNLLHVSDIFLCHSTCKPSNLRFSSLPTFLNEFVNILFSFPLPCYLFPAPYLSSTRSSCYSVCQQSFWSSRNHPTTQQYQFLYHSLIHRARIQVSTFSFLFHVKTCNHPIPIAKTHIHPPFKPLSFSLLPLSSSISPSRRKFFRTLGKLAINNHYLTITTLLLCVCVYVFFSSR